MEAQEYIDPNKFRRVESLAERLLREVHDLSRLGQSVGHNNIYLVLSTTEELKKILSGLLSQRPVPHRSALQPASLADYIVRDGPWNSQANGRTTRGPSQGSGGGAVLGGGQMIQEINTGSGTFGQATFSGTGVVGGSFAASLRPLQATMMEMESIQNLSTMRGIESYQYPEPTKFNSHQNPRGYDDHDTSTHSVVYDPDKANPLTTTTTPQTTPSRDFAGSQEQHQSQTKRKSSIRSKSDPAIATAKGTRPRQTRASSAEGNLKCEFCGKQYRFDWKLEDHKKTHTGEKTFTCGTCNKGFARERDLKKHYSSKMHQRQSERVKVEQLSVDVTTETTSARDSTVVPASQSNDEIMEEAAQASQGPSATTIPRIRKSAGITKRSTRQSTVAPSVRSTMKQKKASRTAIARSVMERSFYNTAPSSFPQPPETAPDSDFTHHSSGRRGEESFLHSSQFDTKFSIPIQEFPYVHQIQEAGLGNDLSPPAQPQRNPPGVFFESCTNQGHGSIDSSRLIDVNQAVLQEHMHTTFLEMLNSNDIASYPAPRRGNETGMEEPDFGNSSQLGSSYFSKQRMSGNWQAG
ncbi:hypothetical protein DFH27DRAFT_522852 [Peziza echinospora]|nr:hypothetical protein DFH27DRAFT_522852 [Peziza echinospora]